MQQAATVLVVDDDWRNRDLMSAFLEPFGVDVVMAEDGPSALRACLQSIPDLILMDVMMPGMDGFEVVRRLRGNPETFEVPVVMVTALNQVGDRVAALESGADDFLAKPVDRTELKARVFSLLKIKAYRDQIAQSRQRVADELDLAANLQKSLLPRRETLTKMHQGCGLAVDYSLLPAGEVCGDFLDVQCMNEQFVAVTLADCKGHGVSAGMMTMAVHALLHSLPEMGLDAAENLTLLARNLAGVLPRREFAAALHLTHQQGTCRVRLARAGLPNPYYGGKSPDSIHQVQAPGAPPLGLGETCPAIKCWETTMKPGDRMVLFSDGLSEAEDDRGGYFGLPSDKLLEVLRRHWSLPMAEFKAAVLGEWLDHRGEEGLDDCSLVVMEQTEPE